MLLRVSALYADNRRAVWFARCVFVLGMVIYLVCGGETLYTFIRTSSLLG